MDQTETKILSRLSGINNTVIVLMYTNLSRSTSLS